PGADAQALTGDPDIAQVFQRIAGQVTGQVDQGVGAADVDAADGGAVQTGLVGDGTDNVAGAYAVLVPDLDAEGGHAGIAVPRRIRARRRPPAIAVLAGGERLAFGAVTAVPGLAL